AAALYFSAQYFTPQLEKSAGLLVQASTLGLMIVTAMVIYFGTAFAFGGASLSMLRGSLRRKGKTATSNNSA
ncbi:lipid II flippase MurJ, partial [Paraburkholderia aspalathi]|nr:lipid II flippase MurJ [Paraburkholderia aspalathi]